MKTLRHNSFIILLLLACTTTFSQSKKLENTYNTNKDVKVNIDSRHTRVIIEHWNKDQVSIEALLDSKNLNPEEAKIQLESWNLETSGDLREVNITSGGGVSWSKEMDMAGFGEAMGSLQLLIAPIMTEMVAPMMENLAENPPLPPDFASKMGNLNFDYEAYQKDGEKYMKKWEKQVENNFGKDFEKSMEKWAAQFEKNAAVWEKNIEKKMALNEGKFEAQMEQWAENFGSKMEQLGERIANDMELKENSVAPKSPNSGKPRTTVRTLRIKVPANARLNLEVRHGEVKIGQRTNNLKANISHSKFSANIIDGENTEVKVSYSPITVSQWNYGVLNTSYVQDVVIDKAKSIKLTSNSSDVNIGEITEIAILSGTFGELSIGKLHPDFKNLDVTLKNSDLRFSLPDAALNFNYNGTQSSIEYPKVGTVKATKSYDKQMLNGFYKATSGKRSISINASFSKIEIK
ncbi:hypothetical protein ACKGJN_09075 [Gillisia sp. Q332]|uniref:hypothetical protein n=1 Tax=Gillisia xinjiangensis TaxID=3384765 RepID=UPI00391B4120